MGSTLTYDWENAGRPPKFESVEALQRAIAIYFFDCDNNMVRMGKIIAHKPRPYTISGLAYALGTSRNVLMTYEDDGDGDEASAFHKNIKPELRQEFSNTIKQAKEMIRVWTEEMLYEGGGITTGVIFNLKNNWGFKDKTEVDNKISGLSLTDLYAASQEAKKPVDSPAVPS